MSTKPKAIRKQDIIEIAALKYQGYEQFNHIPEKFIQTKIVAKLKDKTKTPNFKNILEDVNLMFSYDGHENLLEDDAWIELVVVLKE